MAFRGGCALCLKKENTWCGALVDFRSHIQYSPISLRSRGLDGQCRRWRTAQTDSDGNPNVFNLERNADGLWLDNNWAKPDNTWNPDNQLVFRLRNCFLFRGLTGCGFSFPGYLSFSSIPLAFFRFHQGNRPHLHTVYVRSIWLPMPHT